jgi:hypothetical protein
MSRTLLSLLAALAAACSSAPVETAADGALPLEDASWVDGGPARADAGAPDASGARDWALEPPIVEVDTAQDLWAVGDVHGDYDRLATLLDAAGLAAVPAQPGAATWSGGRQVLVCTGDLIDKWDQALDVIAYLRALQASAAAAGGRVIVTMGNHEAEFLGDPAGTKVADFAAELQAAGLSPARVASGAQAPGPFLRGLPFAARVNDWFFAHAGNTGGETTAQLAASLRAGVDAAGFAAEVLTAADSILETRLDQPAPWWELPGGDPATLLRQWAAAVGAKHIVEGHQPGKVTFSDGTARSRGELFQKFGEIFLIDVGMSRGVDDSLGALLHVHRDALGKTTAAAVFSDGSSAALWHD